MKFWRFSIYSKIYNTRKTMLWLQQFVWTNNKALVNGHVWYMMYLLLKEKTKLTIFLKLQKKISNCTEKKELWFLQKSERDQPALEYRRPWRGRSVAWTVRGWKVPEVGGPWWVQLGSISSSAASLSSIRFGYFIIKVVKVFDFMKLGRFAIKNWDE